MFKNRLLIVIGLFSLVLVSLAVSSFRTNAFPSNREAASDFHQRHPDWGWTANRQNAVIPITGDAAYPDYHQRHPELSNLAMLGQGASDYAERHPELSASAVSSVDLTDYYFRHPELSVSAAQGSIDLTDYYFRHLND